MASALTRLGILSLGVLLTGFSLTGCGQNQSETNARADNNVAAVSDQVARDLHIKVEPVQRQLMAKALHVTGQIHSEFGKEVDVTARIAGRVVGTFVQPGHAVKRGQPLLQIDSQQVGDIQAELIEAKSKLQIAKAQEEREQEIYQDLLRGPKALIEARMKLDETKVQLELSQSEFKRQEGLFKEKIASAKDYNSSQATMKKEEAHFKQAKIDLEREEHLFKNKSLMKRDYLLAQAETARARQHLNTLKQRLAFLGMTVEAINDVLTSEAINAVVTVVAPASGIITHQDVFTGEMVDPGKRALVITDLSAVAVSADIPEVDLAFVKPGVTTKVQIASFPGETFIGTVDYISTKVHPDTRTVQIRARLGNPGLRLKENMFAEIEIEAPPTMALVCPKPAVHQHEGRQIVYVMGKNGYEERPVKVGKSTEKYVEILSGLAEGENVVTEGSLLFKAELTTRG